MFTSFFARTRLEVVATEVNGQLELVEPGHVADAREMAFAKGDDALHLEAVRDAAHTDDVGVCKVPSCYGGNPRDSVTEALDTQQVRRKRTNAPVGPNLPVMADCVG